VLCRCTVVGYMLFVSVQDIAINYIHF